MKYENILKVRIFFGQPFWSYCGVISRKLLVKSRNQKIFQKFELNRDLQRIAFKVLYNVPMLHHRFSNERWGRGGGGALNHLPLLFCKSVYLKYATIQSLLFHHNLLKNN